MYKIKKIKNGCWYYLGGKLNSVIDCVFIEDYFCHKRNQGVPKRIVPDNTVELILTDKIFERKISDQREPTVMKSHLSGLKTTWQDITLEDSPLISIRLRFDKIYQLTGIPASELSNQAIEPSEVFGRQFEKFQDKLFELKTIEQRLSCIEDYFMLQIKHHKIYDDSLLQAALQLINLSWGRVPLHRLCSELNISQKTLETKFKLFIGLTPKNYSRLVRFVFLVKKYKSSKINFTRLAYESNFSDQSHLIKEVRNFTGLNPKTYFSSSLGIQEDIF